MTYTFNNDHKHNFNILLGHVNSMTPDEANKVMGICNFAAGTQKVTYKQLQFMGMMYKKLVQRGVYFHHNWKIWK